MKQINETYISARYPGDIGLLSDGKPTIKEAETFFNSANKIYNKITSSLEKK